MRNRSRFFVGILASGCYGEAEHSILAPPVIIVEVRPSSPVLSVGQTVRLTVATYQFNARRGFSWTSTDEKVVTVSQDGLVAAVGSGQAYILTRAVDNTSLVVPTHVTVR